MQLQYSFCLCCVVLVVVAIPMFRGGAFAATCCRRPTLLSREKIFWKTFFDFENKAKSTMKQLQLAVADTSIHLFQIQSICGWTSACSNWRENVLRALFAQHWRNWLCCFEHTWRSKCRHIAQRRNVDWTGGD